MEAAVRVRYVGGSLDTQAAEAKGTFPVGTLAIGGRLIGSTDEKGKVTLQPEVTSRWFSTEADNPFATVWYKTAGRCAVQATLQPSNDRAG
eukprot:1054461-Prymnesium_polylepis.1